MSRHGTPGAGGVFEGGARLRRVGAGHRASCRRNGCGLQQEAAGFNRIKGGHAAVTASSARSPGPTGSPMSVTVPGTSATPTGPAPSSATVRAKYARASPAQRPGPAPTAPSPTESWSGNRIRRRPNSPSRCLSCALPSPRVRSKAGNGGAVRGRDPVASKSAEAEAMGSHGMPATAPSPSEGRSGAKTGSRSDPTRSDPSSTGTNSRWSSPTGERTRATPLPSMKAKGAQGQGGAGGYPRRTRDALPNGLRAGRDPGRQPIAHVRRRPFPQPHPRTADPPHPRHDRKAHCAAALPGDGNPSPHSHPAHRTHRPPGRQSGPPDEHRRPPGRGIPTRP